jgi:hypothetical protein
MVKSIMALPHSISRWQVGPGKRPKTARQPLRCHCDSRKFRNTDDLHITDQEHTIKVLNTCYSCAHGFVGAYRVTMSHADACTFVAGGG